MPLRGDFGGLFLPAVRKQGPASACSVASATSDSSILSPPHSALSCSLAPSLPSVFPQSLAQAFPTLVITSDMFWLGLTPTCSPS